MIYKLLEKLGQQIMYMVAFVLKINSNDDQIYYSVFNSKMNERIPEDIVKNFSKGIITNSKFPASKRIIFYTNASEFILEVLYKKRCCFEHMSNKATSGIDIYIQNSNNAIKWEKCISPLNNIQMKVCETISIGEGIKEVILFLPAFAQIEQINIGLNKLFYLKINERYSKKTLVIYGSSISQGCAASRPSLSYANILVRKMNMNIINLGFSESAKGEKCFIEYIATLNADIYILEYDHNVSIKDLKITHRRVYEIIRHLNKKCLIIFMTRFSGGISISLEEEEERINIIESTYNFAVINGDKNVELINGRTLFPEDKGDYFVDDRHPNDKGMSLIAEKLYEVIKGRDINC
jgi:hypothetical protein